MLDPIGCCGVVEMVQLRKHGTNESAMREILNYRYNIDGVKRPIILFSEAKDGHQASDTGSKLARYIPRHGLGTVVSSGTVHNGNTDNEIEVWLWMINDEGMSKWAEAHDIDPAW